MKKFNHFVVTGHGNRGLNYFMPWSNHDEREFPPQRMVQWNCAGPCVIGWSRNIVPRRALADDLFTQTKPALSDHGPLGNWFRKRRTVA